MNKEEKFDGSAGAGIILRKDLVDQFINKMGDLHLEEDDIYDDGSSSVSAANKRASAGFSNLKSMFENKDAAASGTANKPFINKPKPVIPTRTKLNSALSPTEKSPPSSSTTTNNIPAWKKTNNTDRSTDTSVQPEKMDVKQDKSPTVPEKPAVAKRDSKSINIPAAFMKDESEPKPLLPSELKKRRNDSNNNEKDPDSAKPSPAQKPVPPAKVNAKVSPAINNIARVPIVGGVGVGSLAKALSQKLEQEGHGLGVNKDQKHPPETPAKPYAKKDTPTKPNYSVRTGSSIGGQVQMRRDQILQGKNKLAHRDQRKSVKSYIRHSDNKRFLLVLETTLTMEEKPPNKPGKLDEEIDITAVTEDFKRELENFVSGGSSGVTEDEIYDECFSEMPGSGRPVSEIKPMSEDEELNEDEKWQQAGITGEDEDFPPPPTADEMYDDAFTANSGMQDTEGGEELYEPLDDIQEVSNISQQQTEPPEVPAEKPKSAKELEKEKKKKEKEEKEKKAKREKELKEIMKKFKVKAHELEANLGKGHVKSPSKGSKTDLAVIQGQDITIIRMVDPNPKGKWLVRYDEGDSMKVGYVESANIQVETDLIRNMPAENIPLLIPIHELYEQAVHEQVMESSYANFTPPGKTPSASTQPVVNNAEDDGEMYEDLPDEPTDVEPIEEDIYEEVPGGD